MCEPDRITDHWSVYLNNDNTLRESMCDDASPCNINALPRPDRADEFERWSVEQAEGQHPHYRYQLVCSKWGFRRVLGQGYRYGEARALTSILKDVCSKARPSEDAWTLPHFGPELMQPQIRWRQEVGDLAFVYHESNHAYHGDGSCSFTSREMLVMIEETTASGNVRRARSISGLLFDDPAIKKCYACDDVHTDLFTQHIRDELAGRSPVEAYDYLTASRRLVETIYRFARNEIERTPFNSALAATCIRHVGLPKGQECPTVSANQLHQQISAILRDPLQERLAA